MSKELEQHGIKQVIVRSEYPQTLGKIEWFWGTVGGNVCRPPCACTWRMKNTSRTFVIHAWNKVTGKLTNIPSTPAIHSA